MNKFKLLTSLEISLSNAVEERFDSGNEFTVSQHVVFVFVKSLEQQLEVPFNRVHVVRLAERPNIVHGHVTLRLFVASAESKIRLDVKFVHDSLADQFD
jgi:hypothetical protein